MPRWYLDESSFHLTSIWWRDLLLFCILNTVEESTFIGEILTNALTIIDRQRLRDGLERHAMQKTAQAVGIALTRLDKVYTRT